MKKGIFLIDATSIMVVMVVLNLMAMGWLFSFTASFAMGASSGESVFLEQDSIIKWLKVCMTVVAGMLAMTIALSTWYVNLKKKKKK